MKTVRNFENYNDSELYSFEYNSDEKLKNKYKPKIASASKEEAKLLKMLNNLFYSKNHTVKKSERYTGFRKSLIRYNSQKCIVKVSYELNNKKKHEAFFRDYLRKRKDKSVIEKPVLFNDQYNEVPDEVIEKYSQELDGKFYRIIVSPGSEKVPIEILIRRLMKDIEDETNTKLIWFAAKHTDTDNTHGHILINGVDKFGREVFFTKNQISNSFRFASRKICTDLIGYRTQSEIDLDNEKLPECKRFCELDDMIQSRAFNLANNEEFEEYCIPWNDAIQRRCATLVSMGLAKRIEKTLPRKYFLEKNWKEKLKTVGRYNSFLEARANLKYTSKVNLIQYESSMGEIRGVITKIYKMNHETSFINAYVIENKTENKAWYVPVRKQPSDKLLNTTVSLKANLNSKGKLTPQLNVLDWGM